MMHSSPHDIMAEYNRLMNQRLYAAAATLPEAEVHEDKGAFFGSLFATLNHIAVADLIWLHRFVQSDGLEALRADMSGFPTPRSLTEPLAGSLPDLSELRAKIDAVIIKLASSITDRELASTLRYANTSGVKQEKDFSRLLQHFFNHQTHHRGQASTLLSQAGVDIGVTDLIAFIPNPSGRRVPG